jgi:hypothetical protein
MEERTRFVDYNLLDIIDEISIDADRGRPGEILRILPEELRRYVVEVYRKITGEAIPLKLCKPSTERSTSSLIGEI